MPFSVRLDPETEAKIRHLVRVTGRSKSDVIREAVAHYEPGVDDRSGSASAFDRVRPFLGVVATGGAQYSTDTHAKYRARLRPARRGSSSD